MQFRKTARLAVCVATITASALAGVAGTSGQARAATAVSGPYVQDSAACAAFRAFERHPSAKRFRVMVGDSRSALWFLRFDVRGWQADRVSHAPGWVQGMDRGLVAQDCKDPAAQMYG